MDYRYNTFAEADFSFFDTSFVQTGKIIIELENTVLKWFNKIISIAPDKSFSAASPDGLSFSAGNSFYSFSPFSSSAAPVLSSETSLSGSTTPSEYDFASSSFSVSSDLYSVYGTDAFLISISGLTWSDFTYDSSGKYDNGYYITHDAVIDSEKADYYLPAHSKDAGMCWAATAANSLFWTGWDSHDDTISVEDHIFQEFRNGFTKGDRYGGRVEYGWEWYLTGSYPAQGWREWDQCRPDSGGFYKDEVPDADLYISLHNNDESSASFLVMAEDALREGNGVGLGLNWHDSRTTLYTGSGHAISLWGLTWNADYVPGTLGYYTGIIVTDSDDDDSYENSAEAPDVMKILPIQWSDTYDAFVIIGYGADGVDAVIDGIQILQRSPFSETFEPVEPEEIVSDFTVSAGTKAASLTVSGGITATVFGLIESSVFTDSGTTLLISSGGSAAGNRISNEAAALVSSGGRVLQTEITSGGTMDVFSGAAAYATDLSGGLMSVHNGGSAIDTLIASNGQVFLSGGGTMHNTVIRSGGTMYLENAVHSGTLYNASGALVSLGENVSIDFTLSNKASYENPAITNLSLIRNWELANYSITISADHSTGTYILAGNVEQFTKTITVKLDNDTLLGTLTLEEGFSQGLQDYNLICSDGQLALKISYLPVANAVKLYSSGTCVSQGPVLSGAVIKARSTNSMFISNSGTASDCIISSGGFMHISGGGTAIGTQLNSKGFLRVSSGGTASQTSMKGGSAVIEAGGAFISAQVASYGDVTLYGSGSSVDIGLYSTVNVFSTAVLSGVTVSRGGTVSVNSQGTICDTVIASGGSCVLARNAVHSGFLTIERQGTMRCTTGATIDFSVNQMQANSPFLINDLSRIGNVYMVNFTLTVDTEQKSGTYALAGNCTYFDNTVTIKNTDGITLGEFTNAEGTVTYGNSTYTLQTAGTTLTLTVAADAPSPAVTETREDINGDGIADIVMQNQTANTAGAWLLDKEGRSSWHVLSELPGSWEITGTNRFNDDSTADILLYDRANNTMGLWLSDGNGGLRWKSLGSLAPETTLIASGDWNGDTIADLLCREQNGTLVFRDISGRENKIFLPEEWSVKTIADINADGFDDLIMQNGTQIGCWLMSESGPLWQHLGTVFEKTQIIGSGDINGDGTEDIILNTEGSWGAWLMTDGKAAAWQAIGNFPDYLALETVADFNADGTDDLRVRLGNDLAVIHLRADAPPVWKTLGSISEEWITAAENLS